MDNNDSTKHLLIVTGPQGSGNHVFSRVFSMHPDVEGWSALTRQYWVPSDQEPFAEYWVYPERLEPERFARSQYFLANVSCPFFFDGRRRIPKILEVAEAAADMGVRVTVAIVVRDRNINSVQQQRVGGEVTITQAEQYYLDNLINNNKFATHFIDHEALFMWREQYIQYLGRILDFPVLQDPVVLKFIDKDANHKYVQPIEHHWLDDEIRAGRRPFSERSRTIGS